MKRGDEPFVAEAIKLARKCPREHGARDPMVAAVVVRDGSVVSSAHRGEVEPGQHAEYIALDVKPAADEIFAGATLYTTLEPCTGRGLTKAGLPKIPCVERVIARKFKRVVIGMLDPNDRVRGLGVMALRRAGIEVDVFDEPFASQIEDLNRDFSRHFASPTKREGAPGAATTPSTTELHAGGSLEQLLAPSDRQRAVVLLTVVPDTADDGRFRFDFETAFHPVRFLRQRTGEAVYFAAFRRAYLDIDVDGGEIVDHAPKAIVPVANSSAQRVQLTTFIVRNRDQTDRPPVTYEKGSTWEGRTNLDGESYELIDTPARRHIRWELKRSREPSGAAYISGTMHGSATIAWEAGRRREGCAELTPAAVDFIDADRRPIGSLRSLVMWHVLRDHSSNVLFRQGCRVKFEVRDAS